MKVLVAVVSLFFLLDCSVADFPPWPDDVKQLKGYMDLNETHGVNYFYWFFESREKPSTDPLVVWLTGGPGCSSMLALLTENGPFLVDNTTYSPFLNKYSWNTAANLLYVDQPAGTGFSYVTNPLKYDTNEKEIAAALWDFLLQFYAKYPKYQHLDLYITGESYAGHYIPAAGQYIVESNSAYAKNLKGIAIGNGWVDPYIQYKAYAEFAFKNGLINTTVKAIADTMYAGCKALLDLKLYPVAFVECQLIEAFVLESSEVTIGRSINPYDIRIPCQVPPLCYDFSLVDTFLNRKDVQADLGVSRTWVECTRLVELFLLADWVHEFQDAVSKVLESKRRVLVYSGDQDFICNYLGGLEWANTTKWASQSEFQAAPFKDWLVGGVKSGRVKAYGDLTFLSVDGAGHMVPRDQPQNAMVMLSQFMDNQPFS